MNFERNSIQIAGQPLPPYEKPTLIEVGELRELVRGSGSAGFDGLVDCAATSGQLVNQDRRCDD